MEMNPWPLGVPETRDFLEKTDSAWPSPQVKKKNALMSVIDPASSVNEAVEDRATLDGGHSQDPSGRKPR